MCGNPVAEIIYILSLYTLYRTWNTYNSFCIVLFFSSKGSSVSVCKKCESNVKLYGKVTINVHEKFFYFVIIFINLAESN